MTRPTDPQLATWHDQLESLDREVRQLTGDLSPSQMQWRPGPGKWSIAECLEHLAITARLGAAHWVPAISAARRRGKTGTGPFSFGWFGRWFVGWVGPNPKRPSPAPAVFAPPASISPGRAIADFTDSQSEIRAIFRSADGLDLGRIKARSAVTPLFRFNLATWFASTVAHQHRHLDQMRRVRTDDHFPKI